MNTIRYQTDQHISVLAQIYYFKPQTLNVSVLFLLVLSYWIGHGMATFIPSHGYWRYLNPGHFNSEFESIKRHIE